MRESLERRKADVIELYQPLSDSMMDIHQAIVQCMGATLSEIKRSNTTVSTVIQQLFRRGTMTDGGT